MKTKDFTKTASIIFLLVAMMHLWLVFNNLSLQVDGVSVGGWVSWLAFVVTGYMAMLGFKVVK